MFHSVGLRELQEMAAAAYGLSAVRSCVNACTFVVFSEKLLRWNVHIGSIQSVRENSKKAGGLSAERSGVLVICSSREASVSQSIARVQATGKASFSQCVGCAFSRAKLARFQAKLLFLSSLFEMFPFCILVAFNSDE